MIKFSGRVNHKIKKKVIKQRDMEVGWMMLAVVIVGGIATLIFSLDAHSLYLELFVPTIILLIMSIYLFVAPIPTNAYRFDWFYNVIIQDGKICKLSYQQANIIVDIKDIKRVIDNGEWYTVIYSGFSNAIICDKNLLVEGTIEEFEALFKGKIKRKKKYKK